jgi:hypothetical protein
MWNHHHIECPEKVVQSETFIWTLTKNITCGKIVKSFICLMRR